MAPLPVFRVLEQSQVSPPPGSVAEASLPLTFFDLVWLNSDPVERIFFYPFPHPACRFIGATLPALKSSLSLALQRFYPLAGKIRRNPGRRDQYEIHYVDGDSVSFTLAELLDADFHDLSGSHEREMTKLVPLIPRISRSGDDRLLLALQLTLFPGHGLTLGIAVHHAACDGNGSMHFLTTWAAACRSALSMPEVTAASPPPPPLFDKSIVADPRRLYAIFLKSFSGSHNPLPHLAEEESGSADLVCATFTLLREHMASLKEVVLARAPSFHCSTVVVAYAYVWVCLVRAGGHSRDGVAHLAFAADSRPRLKPPVPAVYLGNCLAPCMLAVEVEALTREDGFVVASEAIGRTIEEYKVDVLRGAEEWLEKVNAVGRNQPMSVAGAPKFRAYDTDFGWGRPSKVEVPSIRKTGAISLAESREEDGGLEIGVVLPKAEMKEFGAHFSTGLQSLLG